MYNNSNNNHKLKNISNCTIADFNINDIVQNFTVQGSNKIEDWWGSEHSINYEEAQTAIISKSHDQDNLLTTQIFSAPVFTDIWTPVFVSANNNEQKISEKGIYNKPTLGTNEYISFEPAFKENTIRATNGRLVIPWKLNSDNFLFECTKGVLCWVKSLEGKDPKIKTLTWSQIPRYIPFYIADTESSSTGPYIKIDEDRIMDRGPESLDSLRGPIDDQIKSPNDIFGDDYTQKPYTLHKYNFIDSIGDPVFDNKIHNKLMWIPIGDVYSYSENTGGNNSEDKSYISASLYQYYTAIYHSITIRRKRKFSRDLVQSRRYKNLAKYLASSPFITKFAISMMVRDPIQEIVSSHINGSIPLEEALINISSILDKENNNSDFNLEQNQLNNIVRTPTELIDKLRNKYGIKLAINDGSITYSGELNHRDDVAITNVYSMYTKNADHYLSKDSYATLCQKIKVNNYSIESRINNSSEYSGEKENYRSVCVSSRLESGAEADTNKIRLFDSVEPKWDSKLKFNILMQYTDNLESKGKTKEEYSPDNTVFEYDPEENFDLEPNEDWLLQKEIDPVLPQGFVRFNILPEDISAIYDYDSPYFSMIEEAKKQFVFLWEQVSGPPIKFTDYNLSDKGIYDTSSSSKVQVIFSDYARYTIKCTILSPFGNFVKYKTFFVLRSPNKTFNHYGIDKFGQSIKKLVNYTEDPNILNTFNEQRLNYGGPILSEKTQQAIPIVPNRYDYKFVKCCGFKKIAINARGLVWFIDTDFRVGRNGYLEVYIEQLSGPIYKISCSEPSNVTEPYGKLSKPFDIYNTTSDRSRLLTLDYKLSSSDSTAAVYVSKIVLENIRDGSDECAKCLSTYGSDMIGVTAFGGVGKKTLSIDRINNGYALVDFEDNGVDALNYYFLPQYSLDYSPKLYKYGRYATDEFVDRLTGDFAFSNASGLLDSIDKKLFQDSIYSNNIKNSYYPSITGYYLASERTNSAGDDIPSTVPKHKACYQKTLNIIDNNDTDRESYIEFSKGEFHPHSGWILDKFDNNSYVLKFNPGARSTYNFNGPAVFGLNSTNFEYDTVSDNLINSTIQPSILPNIYSSSIGLGISKPIQWDPVCACPPSDDAGDTEREQFRRKGGLRYIQNQIAKEYIDQKGLDFQGLNAIDSTKEVLYQSWHGYRILGGGMPKFTAPNDTEVVDVNDEFVFNKLSYSRNNNRFDYEFAVTGPVYRPSVIDTGTYDFIRGGGSLIPENLDTSVSLRDPRVNDLTIRDLEIKINFLNYVNTQDLIVWLEVKPSDEELRRQRPPGAVKFPTPLNTTTNDFITGQKFPDLIQYKDPSVSFLDSVPSSELLLDENLIYNTGVGDYLKNVIDINSNNPGSNYRLYLLNQEYIQNNKYNLSLRFSDHADIGSHTNDFGISNTVDSVGPHPTTSNTAIEDGDTIAPTLAAMNYNDIDNHIYSNIIKSNKLFPKVNTFSKLINRSLFISPPPIDGPCGPDRLPQQQGDSYNSKTIFTLKIAIVDEPDLMENYDTIINNGILTDYTPSSNTLTSASKFNNLCNWEAVVHTEYSRSYESKSIANDSYGSSDVLSLIDYQAPDDQQKGQWSNGYYGYNFIADMKDKEFLLPLCNINAPYNYIQDFDICSSAQYDQTRSNLLLRTPTYPTEAAVSILAGSLEAGGFIGGVGAAGSSSLDSFGNSSAYRDITGYFSEASRWAQADRRLGQIYNIVHSDYPHGSAEKILLNISKDSCFWYNVEASIFKLSNTPKLDTHKFEIVPLIKITGVDTELSSKEKLVKLFSEFKYEVIEDINDIIDPIFISKNLSLTCDQYKESKNKNTVVQNSEAITINNYDIFKISVEQNDDEECANVNGLYILKPSGTDGYVWSSGFQDLLCNNNLITINNFILDYNNNWWEKNKNTAIIKIDNPVLSDIAYNLGEVEVFTDSNRSETSNVDIEIAHTMKVLLDNKYYSILVLKFNGVIPNDPDTNKEMSFSEYLSLQNIIRMKNKNIGIVINPVWSSNKSDSNAYPGSQWGYSTGDSIGKDLPYDHDGLVPQIYFSLNSVGSYGDSSPKINKNYLHSVVHNNKIKKLYEIFNNNNNFRIKSDLIELYTVSGEHIGSLSDVTSYHYPLNIFTENDQVYNNDIVEIIENTSNTYKHTQSYNSNTLLKNKLYEVIYIIENIPYDSDFYNSDVETYIKIPGVGNLSHPVGISETDKNLLIDRVDELNADIDENLLNRYSGKLNEYIVFFNTYPSIKTALAYYDSIVTQSTSVDNINTVYKIKNNLNLLYEEKNYLQQIIDINYDSQILAPYIFDVKTITDESSYSDNSPDKYDVKLSPNQNYYWINIDPKQSCSLSEELRPKVLKSTKYSCAFLNPNIDSTIVNSVNNNICPRDVTTKVKDGGDENLKLDSNPSFGTDFPLGQTYGYYIPQNKIDQEKKRLQDKYPSIAGWRQQSITRAFYMNSTADIVDVASNPDYVIYVYETYDIALPKEHTIPLTESLKQGIFKNDGSVDINFIQGWSEGCGSSPGGIGLLDSFGFRNKGPSRLCNIFNLDDTSTIRVKFRKIPRVSRGIDFLGSIFRYAPRSQYRQKNTGNPLQPKETTVGQGSLNNHMYLWECLELDKDSKLIKTDLPDLMKIMNEMTFRAFYGSVDGIEYRDLLLMNNEYPHQLIPFEFFTKPPPPPPPTE